MAAPHSQYPIAPNAQAQSREHELVEVLPQAVELFNLPDELFAERLPGFVDERMRQLSEGASSEFMTNATKGTDEFVRPDRLQQLLSKRFLMDDPTLYATLINWVRPQFLEARSLNPNDSEDKSYVNAALRGAVMGQWAYFGSVSGNAEHLLSMEADIIPDFDPENDAAVGDEGDPTRMSIADIGAAAVCQQRGLAVHNTLRILGIDSKYEVGQLAKIINGELEEPVLHAYVVITRNGKRLLTDPTNPIIWRRTGEGVTWLSPQITEIPTGATSLDVALQEVLTEQDGAPQLRTIHNVRYIF